MSDSEENLNGSSKHRSIFSGMGRVKQINHLRERWSPKAKSPRPDQYYIDTPPSPLRNRRLQSDNFFLGPYGRRAFRRRQSESVLSRRQSLAAAVEMERYLAIHTWLEHNHINVAQINTVTGDGEYSKHDVLFDDMYSSLEILENSLHIELSRLNMRGRIKEQKSHEQPLSLELLDYLVVLGPDMLDVNISNYWNEKENVFEATVAFAHPPESQFCTESLEHFCFPTGIKATSVDVPIGGRVDESPSTISEDGDFFVFMISGGGAQGQSVQYAMCMKGTVQVRSGGDDARKLSLPVCYCIIARIPFIQFFRAVLQELIDNLRTELDIASRDESGPLNNFVVDKHAGYIDDILQHLKKTPLPEKGLSVRVDIVPAPRSGFTLARLPKENDVDEKIGLLLHWAFPTLMSRLSVDHLVQILSYLLVEMQLIVISEEIPLLSAVTLGLASLLHPLVWAGPLISYLPPLMHEYIEAPVPLICGVDELPGNFDFSKDTCILDLTGNRVRLHVESGCLFENIRMPEAEDLSSDLTRLTKQMLGRATDSVGDDLTPLSTHLVLHRIRRQVKHLISACKHLSEQPPRQETDHQLDARDLRFIDVFRQTQMYQKYQDDQPFTHSTRQCILSTLTAQTPAPDEPSNGSTQRDDLKAATSALFQIALVGVNTLPPRSLQDT